MKVLQGNSDGSQGDVRCLKEKMGDEVKTIGKKKDVKEVTQPQKNEEGERKTGNAAII